MLNFLVFKEAASEGASDAVTCGKSSCKADSFHQSPTSPNVGAGFNSLATRCVQITMWREADISADCPSWVLQ